MFEKRCTLWQSQEQSTTDPQPNVLLETSFEIFIGHCSRQIFLESKNKYFYQFISITALQRNTQGRPYDFFFFF